jgi:molybdopterin-guanine dinucleotide biosynthesis protein A
MTAIVLAGGLSTRMGRPKALLPWRGRTMIEHVVGILRQATGEIIVVTSTDLDLPALDAVVVRDRAPKLGPLAGIREGLDAMRGDFAFVTSTDAPFLTPAFVKTMLAFRATAAPDVDGFVQSMSAVYAKSLAKAANDLIAANRLRPLFLLESAGFRRVRPDELPDRDSMRSLNTPEDYFEALRRDGQAGSATLEFLGTARAKFGATRDVPPGPLGPILAGLGEHHLISLNGRQFVREPHIPVGPGDRLVIMDAAAGG